MGSAILAAVLAWTAMPAGCLAAPAASPRGGAAPGGGGAGAGTPAVTALWFAPGVAPGGGAEAPGKNGAAVREARRLVAAAADELDALAAAARGEAPRGGAGGQPAFWSGAGALQRALADLDGALAAGDPAFFSILDGAQRSLVALQVAFRRAGTSRQERGAAAAGASTSPASEETTRRMTGLTAAMGLLSGAYSREAVAAARQDGRLSAAQARQLQGMARAARTWRAALPALAAAARQRGDAALQSELAKLDALLRQLASEQSMTLAAYLAAVDVGNQALALWSANAAYFDPGEQQASQPADSAAADLTTAADTGFVFSADLSGGTAWTYAEGPPEGGAAAAGDAGDGGGGAGPGDWGGGPGDAGGPAGAAGGPAGAAGGDESTGLPGEASAGVAGTAGAGAAAGPGAPGAGMAAASAAASSASASAWVVIHGGPDASWGPESSPPADVSPKLALQLGDAQDEELSPGEPAPDSGSDANDANDAGDAWDGASAPLDWEELCRPWQPTAGARGVCPVPPHLPW